MTAFYLGPLGRLRPLDLVQRGASGQASRSGSSWETLGGRRVMQRAPRAPRSWGLSLGSWRDPSQVAHVAACASGALPGPLYLYARDAALTNLLPADVAAPCVAGTAALGSVPGTVAVGMPSGVEVLTGVVQQAAQGAWSATVPLRGTTPLTLSAWASAAGAAIEWRTVTAAGAQVATGTVTAAAVTGGFRGVATFTPGVTAAGVQVRTSAGSRTVGGLRLSEGWDVPRPGVEVRRNMASDPLATANGLVGGAAKWAPRWFGAGGAGTTTLVTGAADGPEIAPGVRISTYMRKAWTAAGGVGDTGFDHTAPAAGAGLPVVAGETYTFSSYMRASVAPAGATVAMRAAFQDASGAQILPLPTPVDVTIVAGQWQRVSMTVTAPAGAATVALWSDVAGGSTWPVGATLDGTGLLVEKSGTLGPWLDGSYSPDPTLVPSWTGTPNASPSILSTVLPADTAPDWLPGVGVPQVVVSDPQQTLQLVTDRVVADYAVTIQEVG